MPDRFPRARAAIADTLANLDPVLHGRWERQAAAEHLDYLTAHLERFRALAPHGAVTGTAAYTELTHAAARLVWLLERWIQERMEEGL